MLDHLPHSLFRHFVRAVREIEPRLGHIQELALVAAAACAPGEVYGLSGSTPVLVLSVHTVIPTNHTPNLHNSRPPNSFHISGCGPHEFRCRPPMPQA
jgi:hypothetical protein